MNEHIDKNKHINADISFLSTKERQRWYDLPPSTHEELIRNADAFIQKEDYNRAITFLNLVLMKDPQHRLSLEKITRCAIKVKDFSLAIDCYQKLILSHGDRSYQIHLAEALYNAGQNDLALDAYIDIKNDLHGDQRLSALKHLGHIFMLKNEIDQAREYYEEALELYPISDELRVYYGALEAQAGHPDEALKWFRSAIELNSNNDLAWTCLAIIHNEYGDLDLAWGNLNKALDINPTNEANLDLYFEWGLIHHHMAAVVSRYQRHGYAIPSGGSLKIILAKAQFCLGHSQKAQDSWKQSHSLTLTTKQPQN